MEISTDDVALLIGQMQIELFALRKENQILKEKLEKLQLSKKEEKRDTTHGIKK